MKLLVLADLHLGETTDPENPRRHGEAIRDVGQVVDVMP